MPMRPSVVTFREDLDRIASEVLDAAGDELEIPRPHGYVPPPASGRRIFRRSASQLANGAADSAAQDEVAKCKADIQKLQVSEAEIRALSFNYAAMLKEREEQLSKLREENGSLRKRLETKVNAATASKDKSPKALSSSSNGISEQLALKSQRRAATQENSHLTSNYAAKVNVPKQDGHNNGVMHAMQPNGVNNLAGKLDSEEYVDELEENNRFLDSIKANLETEIKQLRAKYENEHEKAKIAMQKFEDECKQNSSLQREINELKMDKDRTSVDMKELREELNEKVSKLRGFQESQEPQQSLTSEIVTLKKENVELKMENKELEAKLLLMTSTAQKNNSPDTDTQRRISDMQKVIKEMASSISTLEKTLKDTRNDRDKVLQELTRLKQHLLEKELEDSDKMDEDSKIIEELRAKCGHQNARILQLDRALREEIAKKEEIKKQKSDELQKCNGMVNDLKQKLASFISALESKNVELVNLQTALGQYYAESEAKERLGRDLLVAREELAKLSDSLKVANQGIEISRQEKEDVAAKLLQTEKMLSDCKRSIQKLEEDNSKLRRALEQSMTTLNRMSLDSDNYVDRRIVIKLLVTYFQRNHSKEVLDLMVRMLGFSEEDKQRIGFAQHTAGKGVVRGVLGLPRRLVGGIIGGHTLESSIPATSENQSFADMWVDFLLKETEERERKESSESARASSSSSTHTTSAFPSAALSSNQIPQHSDGEFAKVALTSSTVHSNKQNPFSTLPLR